MGWGGGDLRGGVISKVSHHTTVPSPRLSPDRSMLVSEELDELWNEKVERLIGDTGLQAIPAVLTQLVQCGHCSLKGGRGWRQGHGCSWGSVKGSARRGYA